MNGYSCEEYMELEKKFYQNIINEKISRAWDRNVAVRAKDLEEGTDYSYIHIIKPWVLKETLRLTSETSTILDIGCGCGYLTNAIYVNGRHFITGIDFIAEICFICTEEILSYYICTTEYLFYFYRYQIRSWPGSYAFEQCTGYEGAV